VKLGKHGPSVTRAARCGFWVLGVARGTRLLGTKVAEFGGERIAPLGKTRGSDALGA
jgi:hypothetical protein